MAKRKGEAADPIFAAEMAALEEQHNRQRLPGDGKLVDFRTGERFYPCELRVVDPETGEITTRYQVSRDAAPLPEITQHYHEGEPFTPSGPIVAHVSPLRTHAGFTKWIRDVDAIGNPLDTESLMCSECGMRLDYRRSVSPLRAAAR